MPNILLFDFLKRFVFPCGPFLKSLLNLLQYCFCFMVCFCGVFFFFFLATRHEGSYFPDRGWTHTPCIGRKHLNLLTARKFLEYSTFTIKMRFFRGLLSKYSIQYALTNILTNILPSNSKCYLESLLESFPHSTISMQNVLLTKSPVNG